MKKKTLMRWLAMTLALTMTFNMSSFTVLAAENAAEETVVEETAAETDPADEAEPEDAGSAQDNGGDDTAGDAATAAEDVTDEAETPDAAEDADEAATEVAAEEETIEEGASDEDGEEITVEGEDQTVEKEAKAEAVTVFASTVEIAGKTYSYADLTGAGENEITIMVGDEAHTVSDFTAIGDTGIVYYSADPLTGKLYGTDPAQVTSYTQFYASKGVNASGADYDVITSATGLTGRHAKDIPPIIAKEDGSIVGILDNVEVDAAEFAEASILKAAEKALTQEQEKLLSVTLNEDPFVNPEEAGKSVEIASSSYGYSCKYGDGEFIINPDDSVSGYVWNDYKNALYGAVISDGSASAGAVWWTDLYGESAASGFHYNKIEIAVNNGTSVGSNAADIHRYAAFYNSDKKELKAGTYTITLYARGYNTVSTSVEVKGSFDGEVTAALSEDKKSVELTGIDGMENPRATVTRTEGTGRNAKTITYASDAEIVDGKVALDTTENALIPAVYTVVVNSDQYAPVTTTFEYAYSGYVLMNIPYSVFYGTDGANVADVDAVSSATNKTGNYGFTGGAYHSGTTYDGSGAAGGANGSKMQGVIWAVKAENFSDVAALGGEEVTDESTVTTATAGHGSVTTQTLVGYESLTEKPAYSYYILAEAPSSYLVLNDGNFTAANNASTVDGADVDITYGSHWGDVQANVTAPEVNDKLVSAIVITAEDGTKVGLYHLDQIWRGTQLAWKNSVIDSLDGRKITNIRFYCMVKDGNLTDDAAPDYANYVYDYPVDVTIKKTYTGTVTAAFAGDSEITLAGLPEDAENVKAVAYYVISPRPAVYSYLTPVEVDAASDAFVPVQTEVSDGAITLVEGSVTNAAGTEQAFGKPVLGKIYTVSITSDNYADITASAAYTAVETEIAGVPYVYTDLSALASGTENVAANGKEYALSGFTPIGETGIAYYSESPLSGTLYGVDPENVTSYTALYNSLGVNASAADYDVISSATGFTGRHVRDIPAIVARNEEGIVGVTIADKTVSADAYVEASVLKAAGRELTNAQEEALKIMLNSDPAADPAAAAKAVKIASASYSYSCKYGNGEFVINPDDTVDGYVWSDYKNALYAAVISDGTNKAGAVWWTDLYGESATSGPHYNKVEIAVNNGTSVGSNQATVNRYAAMYHDTLKALKAGTYTVTLYAKGYETVSAEVVVKAPFEGTVTAALSEDASSVELTGTEGMENPKVTVTRTEGSGRQAKVYTYASDAEIVDGKVALDTTTNALIRTIYDVTINSDNYAPVTTSFEYAKDEQNLIVKAAAAKIAVGKTTAVTFAGAQGEVTFTSSDNTIATVSDAGKVAAKKPGSVVITVNSAETDTYKAASKSVTIKVVPAATTKITLTNLAGGVKISWAKVAGATGYKVYRNNKLIKTTTSASVLNITDTVVKSKNGSKFTYKIVAYTKGIGDSTLNKTAATYRLTAPAISSLKNTAAKKMTVKYGRNAKSGGYQIRYSLKKTMASSKSVKVNGNKNVTKVIGGLTKGKKYFVQVRAFKKVGNVTYWSAWSTAKTVTIKK